MEENLNNNLVYDESFEIKYQINNFEDLKLPKRIKTLVESKKNTIFRFLFYGTAGLGKTTLSKILSKNHNILYLSGSNDFNIAKMRNKIYPFCNKFSINDKPKIIIIDECERISKQIQDAFKIVLDSSNKSVKFIFITNDITKLIEPLLSRCDKISFNYTSEELSEQGGYYLQYAVDIAKKENMKFDRDGMMALYKAKFPDFRSLLKTLDELKSGGLDITEKNINKSSSVSGKQIQEIYDLIEKPQDFSAKQFYETLSKYKDKEEEVLNSLCEPFFNYLNSKGKFQATLDVSEIVNKYCVDYDKTMNKFALLISCIYEIRKVTI